MLERRAIADADEPFLRELYASTKPEFALLAPQARELVLDLQLRAQQRDWTARFPHSDHELIVLDGSEVGRIWVAWQPDECRIVDLALSPSVRGRGVGTRIVEAVLDRADEEGVPVAASVASANTRAIAFWERLGFVAVGGDEIYLAYVRCVNTASRPPASRAPSR